MRVKTPAGAPAGYMMGTDSAEISPAATAHSQPLPSTLRRRGPFPKPDTMLYSALKLIHLLAVILWVGGMLFAHCFLRPAAAQLEPPQRLRLMDAVLGPFLNAVLAAIVLILATGALMIGQEAAQAARSGGAFFMPRAWTVMAAGGLVMTAIYGYIRAALYPRLRAAVAASEWPRGGQAMAGIRRWVGVNLALGLLIVAAVFLL